MLIAVSSFGESLHQVLLTALVETDLRKVNKQGWRSKERQPVINLLTASRFSHRGLQLAAQR